MKQYTAEELHSIFREIAPEAALLVPFPPSASEAPPRTPGPAVCVYLRYSELFPGTKDAQNLYWNILRQTPIIGGIGVLASINNFLSEHRSADPEVHKILNQRFLAPGLLAKVAAQQVAGSGVAGVFTRIGCMQIMRHLVLYGKRSSKAAGQSEQNLGLLALLTNDLLPSGLVQDPTQPATLDLLLSFLPVWDIQNPRDLAYALSRMFTILTDILPGTDAQVVNLASKLGLNTSQINIGALTLNDFMATVFGLFAYGRQRKGPEFTVFDVRRIFSKVGFPSAILRKFVRDRALTVTALRKRLGDGKPLTRKNFAEDFEQTSFLTESLNIFRQHPLVKLDATRVLILDLEFLAELLTSGVYWSIFDSLPANRRETFRELWGRLFEIYAVDLLKQFYPEPSGILRSDMNYQTGQIDALLDFGDVVIVFEIKSSLLTESAKRSGKSSQFLPDYERKFVQNAKGAPKALLQLAASCQAVEEGKIVTATKPVRIYPVCVSDEPVVESFFFTTYSNEIFLRQLSAGSHIQPVTMMSINELEEILPYVSANSFSWPELLDFRSRGPTGGAFSVHQAIYDLLRAKALPASRNQAVRKNFDQVWKIIGSRYKPSTRKLNNS
jgi:hypothetical protein